MTNEEMQVELAQILEELSEKPIFHIGRGQYLYDNKGILQFQIIEEGYGEISNSIQLKFIASHDKRQGNGTSMMNDLCAAADKHGITLTLHPTPLGTDEKRLRTVELKKWYRKFGFKQCKERRDNMIRKPYLK